jgi:predicted nucleotidyltransferase
MRLTKADVVAGLPAADAREMARLFYRARPGEVASVVVGDEGWDAAVNAMAAAGFIRLTHETGENRWWITTTNGNALAQASFARPISRKTADRLVTELVERARTINADETLLLSVHQLRIFGSYLREDVDQLGDVDVELVIARRVPSREYVTAARVYSDASGRSFGNYTQYLGWPERELRQKLRNRSTALNITTEDVDDLEVESRIVYTIQDDPTALPVHGDVLYRD